MVVCTRDHSAGGGPTGHARSCAAPHVKGKAALLTACLLRWGAQAQGAQAAAPAPDHANNMALAYVHAGHQPTLLPLHSPRACWPPAHPSPQPVLCTFPCLGEQHVPCIPVHAGHQEEAPPPVGKAKAWGRRERVEWGSTHVGSTAQRNTKKRGRHAGGRQHHTHPPGRGAEWVRRTKELRSTQSTQSNPLAYTAARLQLQQNPTRNCPCRFPCRRLTLGAAGVVVQQRARACSPAEEMTRYAQLP